LQPCVGASLSEGVQIRQSRCGEQAGIIRRWDCSLPCSPEHFEQRTHLVERAAARLLDRRERSGCLLGVLVDHVVRHSCLDRDQAHRVRHHVMELARDLQPFLAARAALLGDLRLCPAFCVLLETARVCVLTTHRIADHPCGGDQHTAFEQLTGGCRDPSAPVDAMSAGTGRSNGPRPGSSLPSPWPWLGSASGGSAIAAWPDSVGERAPSVGRPVHSPQPRDCEHVEGLVRGVALGLHRARRAPDRLQLSRLPIGSHALAAPRYLKSKGKLPGQRVAPVGEE
jgi:hypothetical protein